MRTAILGMGSKRWTNRQLISQRFSLHASGNGLITVIHGDAEGADRICGSVARAYGMQVLPMPADWQRFTTKVAGHNRNMEMIRVASALKECGWRLLGEAFILSDSQGSWDMINLCIQQLKMHPNITELGDAQ